jgi:hypothetical protein
MPENAADLEAHKLRGIAAMAADPAFHAAGSDLADSLYTCIFNGWERPWGRGQQSENDGACISERGGSSGNQSQFRSSPATVLLFRGISTVRAESGSLVLPQAVRNGRR